MAKYTPIEDELRRLGVDPSVLKYAQYDEVFEKNAETPHSSNVSAVRFNPQTGLLYVLFDNHREVAGNRLYQYFGGMQDLDSIFDDIAESDSPGHVVWERLRRSGMPFNKM